MSVHDTFNRLYGDTKNDASLTQIFNSDDCSILFFFTFLLCLYAILSFPIFIYLIWYRLKVKNTPILIEQHFYPQPGNLLLRRNPLLR